MTWSSVESLLNINGFTPSEEASIRTALKDTYNSSITATAANILEKIPPTSRPLEIEKSPGAFQATLGQHKIQIDLDQLNKILYLDQNGKAVSFSLSTALMHEIIHAIEGIADHPRDTHTKSAGPTVEKVNQIRIELGNETLRTSYEGAGLKSNSLVLNKEYSGGKAIDVALLSRGRRDTSASDQNTSDLLIGISATQGGIPINNQFIAGDGEDYLWGFDGNDQLDGGGGNDLIEGGDGIDMAIYRGRRSDYTIKEGSGDLSGSSNFWTIQDKKFGRDGIDTLRDVEILRFADGDISLNSGNPAPRIGQNLVLVVDTSGSMSDDIDEVKKLGTELINAIFGSESNPIDSHFAIVDFNDRPSVSPILTQLFFTKHTSIAERKAAALTALNQLKIRGGGQEPMYQAMIHAVNNTNKNILGNVITGWPLANSNRMVIMTDEAPADPEFREMAISAVKNIAVERWIDSFSQPKPIPPSFLFDYALDEVISVTSAAKPASIFPVVIGNQRDALSAAQELADNTGGKILMAATAAEAAQAVINAISAPITTNNYYRRI